MLDNKNLAIDLMKKEHLFPIKMIVFDVDGVIVPRGTKIKQDEGSLFLEIKKISKEISEQVKKLAEIGYHINISSGRGLYMLQNMFRDILPYVSLTFENGSATWHKGEIIQHVNTFEKLREINQELLKVNHENIKGFEPKEFIITIHCEDRVGEIEEIVDKYNELYFLWNGEAYHIGIKEIHSKGEGIRQLKKVLGFEKENILAIGDNYNDKELLNEAGIAVSADKERIEGHYHIPYSENLPAFHLMEKIIELMEGERIETEKKEKIVINSGYFDPLHIGHIECMELSKKLGDKLVLILNNDLQCCLKKGREFMPLNERRKIIESLGVVDEVLIAIDKDRSVCESIKAIAEKYKGKELIFAKGGDRFKDEIPEAKVCKEYGIKIIDNVGKKIQSSSYLTGLKEIK
ncbi:MAG: HAD-IIB family hydrolase [archaeon]